jgi:hypothetical protein
MQERPTMETANADQARCPFRDSEWDPKEPETFGSAHTTYAALREPAAVEQ